MCTWRRSFYSIQRTITVHHLIHSLHYNRYVCSRRSLVTSKYRDFIHRLVDDCYADREKRIESPNSIGYRHKMTYDFNYVHDHGISHLGIPSVNAICTALYHFAYSECTTLPTSFWSEMMVQHSRSNRILIRITIDPTDSEELNLFIHSVGPQLVDYLLDCTQCTECTPFECIESIVYTQCLSKGSKPSKYSDYHCLYGNGTISHLTAISQIEVQLSCGTFCEPNLKMEQKQFEHIHRWIGDTSC